MVKNVIAKLDSSKASGPDCISVVILKNSEPEIWYILAELWKVSEGVLLSSMFEGLIGGACI